MAIPNKSNKLFETTLDMIVAHLKVGMPDALKEVSEDNNNRVPLELPKEYFIYEPTQAYRAPAIFVILDDGDFKLDRGQNFIDATARINVAVVVENRDGNLLTRQAFRYMSAMHKLLQQKRLWDPEREVAITIKVTSFQPSGIYTDAGKSGEPRGAMRKEMWLLCDVEHSEKLS